MAQSTDTLPDIAPDARAESSRRLTVLGELGRLLQGGGAPELQMRESLSRLMEMAGATEGALYLTDRDERLRRAARQGAADLFPALLDTRPGVSLPASFVAYPRVLDARSPVGRVGVLDLLRARGLTGGLLAPVLQAGRLGGVAVLAGGPPPDAELRALLTQAGTLLGMARETRGLREDVRELRLRFDDLSHSSVDHIWEVDARGRYTYNSEGVVQLLGYLPDAMLGRRPLDFAHPEDRERLTSTLAELAELKQPITDLVHRALAADGSEVYLESRAFPVLDARGELQGYRGVDHNITDWFQARRVMEETLIGTCEALGRMVELRDPYTKGHSLRVAALAVFLGKQMGRSSYELQGLQLMGLLHDIGKVGIPTEILSKPGRLSPEELEIMRQHPQMGYEILKDIGFPWPVAQVVLQHHERLDGSGYPQGLEGGELIWQVRLLAVADLIEAMSTDRPYRPGLGLELTLRELRQNRGLLYDPEIVDVALAAAESGALQAHLDEHPVRGAGETSPPLSPAR
ncbi:MAG: HD domain-containing phosphohydrolase [Candidatus Krumholzibacteriia bacterium]|nr:HD domain-containing protein [bacterium]MCB9516625.1 HD domain-containing protein [Candidatus Latescibacterota bacterium]